MLKHNTYTKILIIDSSTPYTNQIIQQLKSTVLLQSAFPQYKTAAASTGLEGLLSAQDFQPDCVLLNYDLPDMGGLEFINSLTEICSGVTVPILLLVEQNSQTDIADPLQLVVQDCLVKGEFDELQLAGAIFCALEQAKLQKQLQRKHEELKIFADRMAHDLLVSLSKLSLCAEYLEMNTETDAIQDTEQQYALNAMVESVDQTISLVESFRDYAHVDRVKIEFSKVNLNSIMDHILLLLKPDLDATGAKIHVEPLPVVIGDPIGLGQLLHNLVANAIKYSHDSSVIHIRTKKQDNEWKISITDRTVKSEKDKPAFPSAVSVGPSAAGLHRRPAVLNPFMNQPSNGQYPGAGIELAICRKIVDQHGGEVGFCSTTADDSTVYFTIKRDLNANTTTNRSNRYTFEDIALSNQHYSIPAGVLQ